MAAEQLALSRWFYQNSRPSRSWPAFRGGCGPRPRRPGACQGSFGTWLSHTGGKDSKSGMIATGIGFSGRFAVTYLPPYCSHACCDLAACPATCCRDTARWPKADTPGLSSQADHGCSVLFGWHNTRRAFPPDVEIRTVLHIAFLERS